MFLPRYRAARERLALGLLCVVLHVGLESVGFVFGMSSISVTQDRVMMLYPSGCLNPITLHITRLCLRVASALCPLPFVLQVLGAPI
jgi:hypothetical protein